MKSRKSYNTVVDPGRLDQPATSNKTKAEKTTILDPMYTPLSAKGITPGQSSKRRRLNDQPSKMGHFLPMLNINTGARQYAKSPSEVGLSILTPTSDILTATHNKKQTFPEPAVNLTSCLTKYSGGTTVDIEKATAPAKPIVRQIGYSPNTAVFMPQIKKEETFDTLNIHFSQIRRSTSVFNLSVEKARRWADAINIPEGLYNEEEKDLFFRLAMRGFEPLIPEQWRSDFPTLPYTLFSDAEDDSGPLIHTFKSSKTYATRSLATLFSLGGRVRDCRILENDPEILIKTTINQYVRWALSDADIHTKPDSIPLYVIYAQKKDETTLEAVRKINRRLQLLASRHREALSIDRGHSSIDLQPNEEDNVCSVPSLIYPLLIGFIICGPIMAILTLSTDLLGTTHDADSKYICQFDLEDARHDVWNSFAVAITVMKIRKTTLQLADSGLVGFVRLPLGTRSTPDVDI
ncbi:hypothetical protein BDV26DRAFT_89356 [Aspergillus bertholletiae]|uniref:Uncharacterized protein n=1 Tax=Aspergillus bertholletiae TaxID=1226010 RepID=A0A5N7ATM0_9EURO|nr:hypothetical protein BDV26DRAFT_89356 [Aspergillus bertholletiae]